MTSSKVGLWRWKVAALAGIALAGAAVVSAPAAAAPVWVAKIITRLPRTEEELAAAHAASTDPSLQVAVGDPLEVRDFAGKTEYDVTIRDGDRAVARTLPYEYSRLGVVSNGLEVLPEDQANLPPVSSRRIMSRVNGNYISLQVRVQREPESGAVYLYYKPFAAVGAYGSDEAQEFAPLMEDSVNNVRGLGLWVSKTDRPSAEAFRTFVGINKDMMQFENPDGGEPIVQPHYELFFVRLRETDGQFELHTFNTNEFRTRLNYLHPYRAPTSADDCSMKSTIYFTEYTAAKQSPSAKVSRQVDIRPQAYFEISQLDAYVTEQGLEGDAFDNLNVVLDAIIDGKIE